MESYLESLDIPNYYQLKSPTIIGRVAWCHIQLPEETFNQGVSRKHVEISFDEEADRWQIKALSKHQNTYLITQNNKKALLENQRVYLENGDAIYIGTCLFYFRELSDTSHSLNQTTNTPLWMQYAEILVRQNKLPLLLADYSNDKDIKQVLRSVLPQILHPNITVVIKAKQEKESEIVITNHKMIAPIHDNLVIVTTKNVFTPLEKDIFAWFMKNIGQEMNRKEEKKYREFLEEILGNHKFPKIVGKKFCEQMYRLICKVSGSNASVVVTGESGTGKELIARAIHETSAQQKGPFVDENLTGRAENVIENELFGHEKEAYTGAFGQKKGLIEKAEGGTLFLDEIGEISLHLQAKLLRVLQERCIKRIGGHENIYVNFRLICATNKNLRELVEKKMMREDFFYRIHVLEIKLPALRDRKEDISELAEYFLSKEFENNPVRQQKYLSLNAKKILQSHLWKGNVRELQNFIQRIYAFIEERKIMASDIHRLLHIKDIDSENVAPLRKKINVNMIMDLFHELEILAQENNSIKKKEAKEKIAKICGQKGRRLTEKLEAHEWISKDGQHDYKLAKNFGKYYDFSISNCSHCSNSAENNDNSFNIAVERYNNFDKNKKDNMLLKKILRYQCSKCKKKSCYVTKYHLVDVRSLE